MNSCPCQSGQEYSDCCQSIIEGKTPAVTAEQLMRARYTAYTKNEIDFVADSHIKIEGDDFDYQAARTWAHESEWLGLQVVSTVKGEAEDTKGKVEFIASFKDKDGNILNHHEIGYFQKVDDLWFYKEGDIQERMPIQRTSPKVGRNAPCHCGSGKKFKKCCA